MISNHFFCSQDPDRMMAEHYLTMPHCFGNMYVILRPGFTREDVMDIRNTDVVLFVFTINTSLDAPWSCPICCENVASTRRLTCLEAESLHIVCVCCCTKLYKDSCSMCRSLAPAAVVQYVLPQGKKVFKLYF